MSLSFQRLRWEDFLLIISSHLIFLLFSFFTVHFKMLTLDRFIFPHNLTSFKPSWIPSRTQSGRLVQIMNGGWWIWEVTVYEMGMEHCIQALNTSKEMEKVLYLLKTLLIFAIYREEVHATWCSSVLFRCDKLFLLMPKWGITQIFQKFYWIIMYTQWSAWILGVR